MFLQDRHFTGHDTGGALGTAKREQEHKNRWAHTFPPRMLRPCFNAHPTGGNWALRGRVISLPQAPQTGPKPEGSVVARWADRLRPRARVPSVLVPFQTPAQSFDRGHLQVLFRSHFSSFLRFRRRTVNQASGTNKAPRPHHTPSSINGAS